ncbi:MAG TPA: MbtH family NRPS accessory protein [Pirellulales bacterium]|jgi:MbtH protein
MTDDNPIVGDDDLMLRMVVNHEGQFSIWSTEVEPPPGWTDIGKRGTKAECLKYINDVWIDMRPLSLCRRMMDYDQKAG